MKKRPGGEARPNNWREKEVFATPTEGNSSMCFIATKWALRQEVSPLAKLILALLCDHLNAKTGQCDPSVSMLARESGMSRASVFRHLAELETAKLIKRKIEPPKRNFYVVMVAEGNVSERDWSHSETVTVSERDPNIERTKKQDSITSVPSVIESAQPAKRTPSKRGTRLPDGWTPSPKVVTWARQKFQATNEELADMLEEFHDVWKARSGRDGLKLDWDATFRNKVRYRLPSLRRQSHNAQRKSFAQMDEERYAATMREADRMREERFNGQYGGLFSQGDVGATPGGNREPDYEADDDDVRQPSAHEKQSRGGGGLLPVFGAYAQSRDSD